MRIATLILGLVLSVGLFLQSMLIFGLSDAIDNEASTQAGALGLLAALLWLIASAVVISAPLVAVALFGVAALISFAGASAFPDLGVWAVFSLGLAAFAFVGWRGKRKADAEKRLLLDAAQSQRVMAGLVVGQYAPVGWGAAPAISAPAGGRCPGCATANAPDARFCANCGLAFAAGATQT